MCVEIWSIDDMARCLELEEMSSTKTEVTAQNSVLNPRQNMSTQVF